mmetsp:Transcript_3373/g.3781  ORF Transcript_3373/g.3781 Transcript_3373/m.3781 type:complete len:410 (+) Transcript_3373:21-1250(+)
MNNSVDKEKPSKKKKVKKCRYGDKCRSENCSFRHPTKQTGNNGINKEDDKTLPNKPIMPKSKRRSKSKKLSNTKKNVTCDNKFVDSRRTDSQDVKSRIILENTTESSQSGSKHSQNSLQQEAGHLLARLKLREQQRNQVDEENSVQELLDEISHTVHQDSRSHVAIHSSIEHIKQTRSPEKDGDDMLKKINLEEDHLLQRIRLLREQRQLYQTKKDENIQKYRELESQRVNYESMFSMQHPEKTKNIYLQGVDVCYEHIQQNHSLNQGAQNSLEKEYVPNKHQDHRMEREKHRRRVQRNPIAKYQEESCRISNRFTNNSSKTTVCREEEKIDLKNSRTRHKHLTKTQRNHIDNQQRARMEGERQECELIRIENERRVRMEGERRERMEEECQVRMEEEHWVRIEKECWV